MSKYKAAIFDLDGTLLDTLDDLWNAVNHTMDVFGYPHRTRDEVRTFVGNGVDRLIVLSIPNGENDRNRGAAIREFRKYYAAHSRIKTKPYEGVRELTARLMKDGIGVAVVSNKLHEAVVELCGIYFPDIKVVCGEREADGIRRKPCPDMVVKAAEELDVPLCDCVYIGDSEVDIVTSQNAGIPCISVLWGFRDRDTLESAGGRIFCQTTEQVRSEICGGV